MKNKYLIISPYFPSEVSHAGSYIYDQVKALKKNLIMIYMLLN